jgi:hypothetical protein
MYYIKGIKLRHIFFTAAVVLLTLAGCSPSLITSNDNAMTDMENRHVLILAPMDNSVFVKNADDVQDDFSKDKREPGVVIRSQICRTIFSMMHAANETQKSNIFSSDSLIGISTYDLNNTFIQEVRIGKDTALTTFYLPTKEWLIKNGKKPDIVAIINSVSYSRGQEFIPSWGHYTPGQTISVPGGTIKTPGMFVGGGGGNSDKLFAEIKFILYDYRNNNWITCGKPVVSKNITIFGLTKGGWEDTFEDIVKTMFEKSPWEKVIKSNIAL